MTKEEIGSLLGEFTWNFGHEFFIETDKGNFVWSDPDYGGDNTLVKYAGDYSTWIGDYCGRGKGKHLIYNYCGVDFKYIQ